MASEHTAVVLLVAASAGPVAATVGAAFALNVPSRIGNVIARGSLGLLVATALGVSAALLAEHST